MFHAKAIIFATGGNCRIFATTSNAHINTGDGLALALRAGFSWCDPEFFQFHQLVFMDTATLLLKVFVVKAVSF